MDAALEIKLIECLSALDGGEPIEHVLSRYPDDAARLRPLLETAAALPALRMEPSQAARANSRKAFLAQASALKAEPTPRRAGRWLARPLTTFASLALALVLVGGVTVAAAASALPGDPLYGVKRLVENARLSFTPDGAARGALSAQFEQERIREIGALLDAGREAEVEFAGVIESIQPNAWLVSGVPVDLDAGTRIDGDPQVGRRAQVRGRTRNGLLMATSIRVESDGGPAPAPTPSPEPEDTATPRPTPQATPTPGHSPTPTRTRTPAPTATATPFEVRFRGLVEAAGAQAWTISGVVVEVTAATEFRDNPAPGHLVEVRALNVGGGRLIALRIERVDEGGGDDNGNANGNDNGNANENDNGNANGNGNDNGNDNDNDNDNDNGNGNGNDNDNDNDDGNGNDNGNTNG
jgi:hypothetical protein